VACAFIDPRMWDDEKFVALDDDAQLLWVYLITGPEATASVPGLIVIGIAGLAEARRRSTHDIAAALDRLRISGMVQLDPTSRLIRVPKAPFYRAPGNANVVRGWYRRWTSLPDSPLKYDHLESFQGALEQAEVADSTRQAFDATFGRDLARRTAFRSGQVKPALQLVSSPPRVPAVQVSLPLEPPIVVVETRDLTPEGCSGDDAEGISDLACPGSGSGEPFGNHSGTIPEWLIPDQKRKRRSETDTGSDPEASRDPRATEPALPTPQQDATSGPVANAEDQPAIVARLARELREKRLERVLRLRALGIGVTLPPPSLHDQVARGEPDGLVRSWFGSAVRDGCDPEAVVRQRGQQLLDALYAAAVRDKSIAGMRETVCYSAKVVDWALTTEAASAGRAPAQRRPPPATPPAISRPEFPVEVPATREQLAESQAVLQEYLRNTAEGERA
jgi:hypothetical protein